MKLIPGLRILATIIFVACGCIFPTYTTDGCVSVKVKPTDINVKLPIAELQGLIQQLQDAGSQMVGEAGTQMRETIDQLNSQMQQRIDQIKNAGSDLINEASQELQSIINNLMEQARALLLEVNKMIKDDIRCIDYVLAQRIKQIVDSAYQIIDKVDVTLKNAIDRIYVRATMLVDTSTNRVAVVLSNTIMLIAKVVIFIIIFIILFWLIRTIYAQKYPKAKILAIGIPVFAILIIGAGIFLLVSKTALSNFLGQQVQVPNWQASCDKGDTYYNDFISMKNDGKSVGELKAVGTNALEQLNWCVYATISPEIAKATSEKIEAINAILWPPAIPPTTTTAPQNSPCSTGDGKVSINPAWLTEVNFNKIRTLTLLSQRNVIVKKPFIDAAEYKVRINTINPGIRMTEPVSKPVTKIKMNVSRFNEGVMKNLSK